jgi:hypothetical protein
VNTSVKQVSSKLIVGGGFWKHSLFEKLVSLFIHVIVQIVPKQQINQNSLKLKTKHKVLEFLHHVLNKQFFEHVIKRYAKY